MPIRYMLAVTLILAVGAGVAPWPAPAIPLLVHRLCRELRGVFGRRAPPLRQALLAGVLETEPPAVESQGWR